MKQIITLILILYLLVGLADAASLSFSGESPENNSVSQSTSLDLSIDISIGDSPYNVSIWVGDYSGYTYDYHCFFNYQTTGDDSFVCHVPDTFLEQNTTYNWYVNATDTAGTVTSGIYYFDTDYILPSISDLSPGNNTELLTYSTISLEGEITKGSNDYYYTIYIRDNISGSVWSEISSDLLDSDESFSESLSNFAEAGHTYKWAVLLDDGINVIDSGYYYFKINDDVIQYNATNCTGAAITYYSPGPGDTIDGSAYPAYVFTAINGTGNAYNISVECREYNETEYVVDHFYGLSGITDSMGWFQRADGEYMLNPQSTYYYRFVFEDQCGTHTTDDITFYTSGGTVTTTTTTIPTTTTTISYGGDNRWVNTVLGVEPICMINHDDTLYFRYADLYTYDYPNVTSMIAISDDYMYSDCAFGEIGNKLITGSVYNGSITHVAALEGDNWVADNTGLSYPTTWKIHKFFTEDGVYAIGGYIKNYLLYHYDTETETWYNESWLSANSRLYDLVAYNSTFWIFGGSFTSIKIGPQSVTTNGIAAIDFESGEVTNLSEPFLGEVYSIIKYNDVILVGGPIENLVWEYNLTSQTWTRPVNMTGHNVNGFVRSTDEILIYGDFSGVNSGSCGSTIVYNMTTKQANYSYCRETDEEVYSATLYKGTYFIGGETGIALTYWNDSLETSILATCEDYGYYSTPQIGLSCSSVYMGISGSYTCYSCRSTASDWDLRQIRICDGNNSITLDQVYYNGFWYNQSNTTIDCSSAYEGGYCLDGYCFQVNTTFTDFEINTSLDCSNMTHMLLNGSAIPFAVCGITQPLGVPHTAVLFLIIIVFCTWAITRHFIPPTMAGLLMFNLEYYYLPQVFRVLIPLVIAFLIAATLIYLRWGPKKE